MPASELPPPHPGGYRNPLFDVDRPRGAHSGGVGVGERGASGEIFQIFRQSGERAAHPDAGSRVEVDHDAVGGAGQRQEEGFQIMVAVRTPGRHLEVQIEF
ncbi:MAG: hypothetical protein L6W00_01245 [Lentisphaeria bacterium]|nr:MAG: hypothetical protein L6W00_01245 [Lentisphaeria bacterium]